MARQNKISTMRIYRTVDGELVGEGDPRAAFLAYAVGSEVPAEQVAQYDAYVAGREQAMAASEPDPAPHADDTANVLAAFDVGRTEAGELVHNDDPRATVMLYAEGDEIVLREDVDAYRVLVEADRIKAEAEAAAAEDTKAVAKSTNKAAAKPANK